MLIFLKFNILSLFSLIFLLFSVISSLHFIILIFSFILLYFSFSLTTVLNHSWLISRYINTWDIRVSILFKQALQSYCFFFIFLVVFNTFFIIPAVRENTGAKLALGIPAETPITLAKEIIDSPHFLQIKPLKPGQNNQKQQCHHYSIFLLEFLNSNSFQLWLFHFVWSLKLELSAVSIEWYLFTFKINKDYIIIFSKS